MDISKELFLLRQMAEISQAELARISSLTPAAISLLEKGDREPSLSSALKISKALNISIYALIGEIEYPHNEFTVRGELIKANQKLAQIRRLTAKD